MLDLISPLPMLNDKNAILVIIDMFSKLVKLEAVTVKLDSKGFAEILCR
jgi:hypothetical protein